MKPSRGIKQRGKKNRKRKPTLLYVAEGNNKTESIYLNNFKGRGQPTIISVAGNFTDPVKMMNQLKKEADSRGLSLKDGDIAYCIIDTDAQKEKQTQIATVYAKATKLCQVITSSPCFEEWLLCHYRYSTQHHTNAQALNELKSFCPKYKKNKNIFPQIKDKMDTAICNAKKLEEYHITQGRSPHSVYSNPRSDIYKIIEFLSNR